MITAAGSPGTPSRDPDWEEAVLLAEEAARRGVPVPAEFQYELEVRESCRRGINPWPTFQEYVDYCNPDIMRYEHAAMLISVAELVLSGVISRLMVMLPPRYFKALANDTPIATPSGWTQIGDLQRGDTIFAGDGTPTQVIGVQRWPQRPTYKVTAADGAIVHASEDHLWQVWNPQTQNWVVRNTKSLVEDGVWHKSSAGTRQRNVRIPVAGALELENVELPIPPYTLGAWLGDGNKTGARICCGDGDQEEILQAIREDGYVVEPDRHNGGERADMFAILGSGGRWDRKTGLHSALRRCGLLGNKHIPEVYFRASRSQRLALLQGLIDTDGHVHHRSGQVQFGNSNRKLIEQVQELVWTLGVKASKCEFRKKLKGEDMGPAWYINFHLAGAARLRRKRLRTRDAEERNATRPLSFERGPSVAMTCIAVGHPSKLFLAGRGMIVTHNTEIFGRLLCSYFLRRNPRKLVGIGSYNASRAWEVSEQARTYFQYSGGVLRPGAQAKKFWGPPDGGELWAAGVQEGTLGRGYHLGVMDDPVDPEKARSPVYQRRFQQFWPEKWISRQEPDAAIILDMQRLGMEDPIDFLFRREVGENTQLAPEHWSVLVMDEVKSDEPLGRWDGPQGLPPTCTLIEDTRAKGQLLAPTRFSAVQVKKIRDGSGNLTIASQRQQRPMSPTGDFWEKKWFRTYDALPAGAYNKGRDWDTAYTKEEANSATAWLESYRGPGPAEEFPIYIHDLDWDWRVFPDLVKWMESLSGPHYVEEKASGKSAIQALKVHGIVAEPVPVKGDKFARSAAVQPTVSNRRIYVRESVYDLLLSGEGQGLLRVTAEALQAGLGGLDLNDVFVQALHRHLGLYSKPDKPEARWR